MTRVDTGVFICVKTVSKIKLQDMGTGIHLCVLKNDSKNILKSKSDPAC